jgi:tetratricopeptide (TPR) repeat protein
MDNARANGLGGDPGSRLAFAEALIRVGRTSDAVQELRAALEEQPDNLAGYGLLSSTLVDRLNQPDNAVEVGRSALARFPDAIGMQNNLAYSLLMAGRTVEAARIIESWDIVGAPSEHRPYLYATSGLLRLHRGEEAEGLRRYEEAIASAGSEGLRTLLKTKRDLEWSKRLRHAGSRGRRVIELLERAMSAGEDGEPYTTHARELARAITGDDPGE